MNSSDNGPLPVFGTLGVTSVIVGIVVGIGIFRLPANVARNSPTEWHYIGFWIAGGLISLLGALCYAELASNYPDAGGEYHFLSKAFGDPVGFLFVWGRATVIQTGSIAIAGFILGDYATEIIHLGPKSSAIYAALSVIGLTGLNLIGTSPSKTTQAIITGAVVIILLSVGILGVTMGPNGTTSPTAPPSASAGAAMIFVLLTYGGWNEGVYLSSELKSGSQNMSRSLIFGLLLVTGLYVLVNLAYLEVLGLEVMRQTDAIGVALTDQIVGTASSKFMAAIVVLAALSTINATIITGARTNYALGRDYGLFGWLGEWNTERNTPVPALLVQGAITLGLIGLGSITQEAVKTLVDYTAPVFWFFILLTTASLFVFRSRHTEGSMNYQSPFYPITPLLFITACGYLLYSSVVFTGMGALVGIMILILGVPVYLVSRLY
jgi:amino acid transporter